LLLFFFRETVAATIYADESPAIFIHDVPSPAPAPAIAESFVTASNETVAEALQRWQELDKSVRSVLAAAQPAEPGRRRWAPKPDAENCVIAQRVGWLYRRDFAREPESVYAIALSEGIERVNVTRGITAALGALA
jgi:hypothetical protein